MTKEQAYEKLELPVGTDLQVVRRKFNQMYNEFLMHIDGVSFSPTMKQRMEQQLEDLKVAFAILNESKGVDDSASLPYTEKTFFQEESFQKAAYTIPPPPVPPIPSQMPEQQYMAYTERHASPIREPKWWYVVITIPMLIACALLIAELATAGGYTRGLFGQAFCWVIGTIIGNSILLNHFSPTLVPPYLRGSWFQGIRGGITLFTILALTGYLVYMLYTTGANSTKIYGIRWSHYKEYAGSGIVILQFGWLLFMGLMFIIGLANPRTLYFQERGSIVGALAALVGYQMILIFCLFMTVPSDERLRNISDGSYYGNPDWYNEELPDEEYEYETDSVQ
ncbi:hypothetical protein H8B06_13860 [Sphingobacterium sp. DN00404]|uniref:Uncharacterized protein n=1 Tax=Sphingobacterium micropteri TaxID=2763501 RepID=A0ABR7YRE4_9SPHI|nr:hypothetical protein [Sphingobacterium micropteri]MBD1433919.1 hypothetical protein [Sphingobacterium micropteri]